MTGSFVILWYTSPVGFTCRHLWIIAVFTLYFINAFITWASHSRRFATGVYHWHFVLYKDGFIGLTSFLIIFLSSSGAFNSCYCFNGSFYYHGRGRIPLNTDFFYMRKNDTVYPAVVAICLSLELVVFAAIAKFWWNGLQTMRWNEKARAEKWEAAQSGTRPMYKHQRFIISEIIYFFIFSLNEYNIKTIGMRNRRKNLSTIY